MENLISAAQMEGVIGRGCRIDSQILDDGVEASSAHGVQWG